MGSLESSPIILIVFVPLILRLPSLSLIRYPSISSLRKLSWKHLEKTATNALIFFPFCSIKTLHSVVWCFWFPVCTVRSTKRLRRIHRRRHHQQPDNERYIQSCTRSLLPGSGRSILPENASLDTWTRLIYKICDWYRKVSHRHWRQ